MSQVLVVKIVLLSLLVLGVAIAVYRTRKERKNMLLLFVSCAIALLLAEGIVRWFFPQTFSLQSLFQREAELGWSFVPNLETDLNFPGVEEHVMKINSDGFRDREFSLRKDQKKILVMGDSFVSNLAVDDEEVFTEIMEAQLDRTEVLNLGVNGYSPLQSSLLLRSWLDRVEVEEVFFFIYLRNDFTDNVSTNWMLPRPITGIDSLSQTLKSPFIPEQSLNEQHKTFSLRDVSHLYALLDNFLKAHFDESDGKGHLAPEQMLCKKQWSPEMQELNRILETILLSVSDTCSERGVKLTFVLAPSMYQASSSKWKELLRRTGMNANDYDRWAPNKSLAAFMQQHQLQFIDLTSAFDAADHSEKPLYNDFEQHWTAEGNRVVAEQLLTRVN